MAPVWVTGVGFASLNFYLFYIVLLLLPLLVVREVVEDGGGMLVASNDLEHLPGFVQGHFLSVPRVGHRLVLVVLQADMPELAVGNVLDEDPAHIKSALPLVLRPDACTGVVVHGGTHLSDTAEVPAAVHTEQQVEGTLAGKRPVSSVQTLVSVLRATPYVVLD